MFIPAFSYPGGKVRLRKWLHYYVPISGRMYIEPFAGRANLFWLVAQWHKFDRWILNDIRTWRFFHALKRIDINEIPDCWATQQFMDECALNPDSDLAQVIAPRFTYCGGGWWNRAASKSLNSRSYSSETYKKHVSEAKRLLEKTQTEIYAFDVKDLFEHLPELTDQDFMYLDPPYINIKETVSYGNADVDYDWLISFLCATKCRWLLSDYENHKYLSAFGEPIARKAVKCIMSGGGHNVKYKAEKPGRVECLWMNPG